MALAQGFGTWIKGPSILIRLGPDCFKVRVPYLAVVTAVEDIDGYMVLQGAAGRLNWAGSIEAVRIVNQMAGKPVRWYRLGPDPYQMRQTQGLNDGKRIKMSKEKLEFPKHGAHDIHPGREGHNKIDRPAGVKIGADLLKALHAGRIVVTSSTLPDGVTFDSVQAAFEKGENVLTGVESTDISHDGQKRAQKVKLFYHLAASSEELTLEFTYSLPD